jgi:hypothetical protein
LKPQTKLSEGASKQYRDRWKQQNFPLFLVSSGFDAGLQAKNSARKEKTSQNVDPSSQDLHFPTTIHRSLCLMKISLMQRVRISELVVIVATLGLARG